MEAEVLSTGGEHRPARSTVAVWLAGGYPVEIEAIAVLGQGDRGR
jgi:enamine deaminase RidA (YjgF/YER057c/UK114 family)